MRTALEAVQGAITNLEALDIDVEHEEGGTTFSIGTALARLREAERKIGVGTPADLAGTDLMRAMLKAVAGAHFSRKGPTVFFGDDDLAATSEVAVEVRRGDGGWHLTVRE